jgi:magnesium-transporting ATPase (P-type)
LSVSLLAVLVGNALGAIGGAGLFKLTGNPDGGVFEAVHRIVSEHVSAPLAVTFLRSLAGGALVCVAAWLFFRSGTLTDKLIAVLVPVVLLGAAGFQYCVVEFTLIAQYLLLGGLQLPGITGAYLDVQSAIFLAYVGVVVAGNLLGGPALVVLVHKSTKGSAANGQPAAPAQALSIWHALSEAAVVARLETQPAGLTDSEADRRLTIYGENRLAPAAKRGPVRRFLAQFHDVLIYVLLGAALVTALLEHWIDTGVIVGVVVINAIIGFIQEGKAESALESIRNMLSPQADVQRQGREKTVSAQVLVPGDIVLLRAGDKVPADLRLLWTKNLRVDEAILTGESVPVEKTAERVPQACPLAERNNMGYAGTLVTYGQGRGVVVATADCTELGRISRLLREVESLTTPLLRQLGRFGRWLTAAILLGAALTFAIGVLLQGYSADDLFMAVVGLAVAAIPEGLPAILTITLAIGVQRMAGRKAIIRRLPAVETLGSVTVICTDKTGTLTRN